MKLQTVLLLFFSKFCASKSGVRLIYGCGLYTDVYGIHKKSKRKISSHDVQNKNDHVQMQKTKSLQRKCLIASATATMQHKTAPQKNALPISLHLLSSFLPPNSFLHNLFLLHNFKIATKTFARNVILVLIHLHICRLP